MGSLLTFLEKEDVLMVLSPCIECSATYEEAKKNQSKLLLRNLQLACFEYSEHDLHTSKY